LIQTGKFIQNEKTTQITKPLQSFHSIDPLLMTYGRFADPIASRRGPVERSMNSFIAQQLARTRSLIQSTHARSNQLGTRLEIPASLQKRNLHMPPSRELVGVHEPENLTQEINKYEPQRIGVRLVQWFQETARYRVAAHRTVNEYKES
jgi:hypothetical protein